MSTHFRDYLQKRYLEENEEYSETNFLHWFYCLDIHKLCGLVDMFAAYERASVREDSTI